MAQYYNNYPPNLGQGPPGPGPPGQRPQPMRAPTCDGQGSCCLAVGGICQCILGLLSIIFGAVMLSNGTLGIVLNIYVPLWGGVLFLLAGVFGLSIVCCPGDAGCNKCLIIGYIVMSVIAILVALVQVAWEGWVAALFQIPFDVLCSNILGTIDATVFDVIGFGCDDYSLVYYMHVGAAVVAGIEVIVALISSILGCIRCCAAPETQVNNNMIVAGSPNNGMPPPYATQGMSPYGQQQYGQNPSPYGQQYGRNPAPPSAGYGQNPSVYYSGKQTMFQPQGYM